MALLPETAPKNGGITTSATSVSHDTVDLASVAEVRLQRLGNAGVGRTSTASSADGFAAPTGAPPLAL
jgi:hypothetical protein